MNDEERRLIAQQTATLDRLNSELSRRQDYTNLLLLRMLLAQGLEPPEAVKHLLDMIPESEKLRGIAVPLGIPYSNLDRQTITATTYTTIVEWEINAGHTAELFEISLASNNYAKTQFKLLISDIEQWTDKYLITAFTQRFKGNELSEKTKVILQAKSYDGTEIIAYGAIAGKLVPPSYRKDLYGL